MSELLSEHTTLRLGGPAAEVVRAEDEQTLIDTVAAADRDGRPVLLLSGGSNLVIADEGFDGLVVLVRTRGVQPDTDGTDPACGGVGVRVAAGEVWDEFVATAVRREWVGIEALAGIPGLVGATPIQNVGAYGQEVADVIASVRVWDRREARIRTLAHAECRFSYRHSLFKADPDRYVVLSVDFQFRQGTLGSPVRYAELARTLGVEPGQRAEAAAVREAVLALRAGKGMVLDAADHDTWSAGSFFTNPILTPDQADTLPPEAPRFAQPDGRVKTSAAWLIDHAGFGKGYGLDRDGGRVSLSTKHALALTNRGGAATADLLRLAREVRDGVRTAYGVELVNEPVTVGCAL